MKSKRKSLENQENYAVTKSSIDQDTGSTEVAVTDTDKLETISNLIPKLVKEKKETDLDLRMKNTETVETVIPFLKKAPSELL